MSNPAMPVVCNQVSVCGMDIGGGEWSEAWMCCCGGFRLLAYDATIVV